MSPRASLWWTCRLNHIPFSSVRQLIHTKSIAGTTDHVTVTNADDFRIVSTDSSDMHGPLTVRSRHGHYYRVIFIGDYSRFPVVYFLSRRLTLLLSFHTLRPLFLSNPYHSLILHLSCALPLLCFLPLTNLPSSRASCGTHPRTSCGSSPHLLRLSPLLPLCSIFLARRGAVKCYNKKNFSNSALLYILYYRTT